MFYQTYIIFLLTCVCGGKPAFVVHNFFEFLNETLTLLDIFICHLNRTALCFFSSFGTFMYHSASFLFFRAAVKHKFSLWLLQKS